MESFTMEDLRTYLQQVRGETRVKSKEESIRNRFLQTAFEEIYREHDWPFTEETAVLTSPDVDGNFPAPADFSPANGFILTDGMTSYGKLKAKYNMNKTTGVLIFPGLASDAPSLAYHIKAPDLIEDPSTVGFFPNPMLIAERAYVRLKTAYFPDESSKEELAMSKRNLRELYKEMVPKQNFTHWTWGTRNANN